MAAARPWRMSFSKRRNMTEDEKQKATLSLRAYTAIFLDILGQSSKLQKLRELQWWHLTDETKTLLSETYGRVRRFRDVLDRFLSKFEQPTHIGRQFLESSPTAQELTLWNASRMSDNLRITSISDSIIALFPIQVRDGVFPFSSILMLMGACCNTMLSSLCEQRAIRGGMAIGPCIYNSDTDEVYGSAVSVAVELEKSADWPRILVDPEIVRVGRVFAAYKGTSKADKLNSTFAQLCLSLVAEDADGRLHLDYLGEGIRHLYDIPAVLTEKARHFIVSQISEHAGDERLLHKYQKVQEYFRKHGLT
jgi:hypothetical protein